MKLSKLTKRTISDLAIAASQEENLVTLEARRYYLLVQARKTNSRTAMNTYIKKYLSLKNS